MKDYFENEGFDVKSPSEAIKLAYQAGLVKDGELWVAAFEDRNLASHTYDEAKIDKIVEKIQGTNFILLKKLYLF
jgi:nucleotidyltransferase substrate binding protein (TIGR01987 family)